MGGGNAKSLIGIYSNKLWRTYRGLNVKSEAIIIVLMISAFLTVGCVENDSAEQSVGVDNVKYPAPADIRTGNSTEDPIVPSDVKLVNVTDTIPDTPTSGTPAFSVTHPSITIISPTENGNVSSRNIVKGTSTNISGSNLNIYVLVCPIESQEWWVQPNVKLLSNGNWSTNAFFGDQANLQKDSGKKFMITVIATSTKLERGRTLEDIPENVYQVDITEVVRT